MSSTMRLLVISGIVIVAVGGVWLLLEPGEQQQAREFSQAGDTGEADLAMEGASGSHNDNESVVIEERTPGVPREPDVRRAEIAAEVHALSIEGRVVDADGDSMGGAAVAAYHPDTAAIRTKTSRDGVFSICLPRPDSYRVSAKKEHYNTAVQENVPSGTGGLVLVLEELSRVSGSVVEAGTGEPIDRFDVVYLEIPPGHEEHWRNIARASDTTWRSFQDPAGAFLIEDVVSGQPFAIGARAEGFEPAYVELPAIEPGAEAEDVVMALMAEAVVAGRVVTPSKDPVAGASVHIGEDVKRHAVAYTDSGGRFEIRGLGNEEVLMSAAHPDYVPGSATVRPVRGAVVEIEITVGEGGTIEGTVFQAGEPIAGQLVLVSRLTGGRFHKEGTTDATGHYAVLGVPPGEVEVMVQIRHAEDKAPMRLQRKAAVEPGGVTIVDFEFPAMLGSVEGFVTVNGEPPAEGRVKLTVTSDAGDSIYTAKLDESGYYAMDAIAPGRGWVEASIRSQADAQLQKSIELAIGEGEQLRQDIAFDAQSAVYGTIHGFVSGWHGVVVAVEGHVDVDPSDMAQLLQLERVNVSQAAIDEEGAYRLEGVPAGDYTVVAIAFDSQADTGNELLASTRIASSAVTVQEGQQVHADLSLQ